MNNRSFFLAILAGWSWAGAPVWALGDLEMLQKSLQIPQSIAQISDSFGVAQTQVPEFILIQDVHRHPEVQSHITALLLHAHYHWGMKAVYMEGTYAGQSYMPTRTEEPLRARLQNGALSGAEAAAIMVKGGELLLLGMEDPEIYRQNVQAYQQAENCLPQALREIKTARLFRDTLDLSSQPSAEKQRQHLELLARLKLKPLEYSQYMKSTTQHPNSKQLAQLLAPSERFYELVDERSRIFVETALQEARPGPKVFIVGGFHTAEMAEDLRAAGKSFVVLTPQVTRSGYEHLYAQRMNETISALKLH